VKRAEAEVLDILQSARGRGKDGLSSEQQEALAAAIYVLEEDGGLKAPTASPLIDGQWKLLYTSRPGSSSPIQRTFTAVDAFTVFQEVYLRQSDKARINNCVDFGEQVGILRVEAEANTDTRPIPGFVPRRGAGLPFLGKSSTYPPSRPNQRIDFQFDRAAFNFYRLPFQIPYPVPFRLVGDEGKGWIDVTYMSKDGEFRISRGNKGTTFVLVKSKTAVEELLDVVASGASEATVLAKIEGMKNVTKAPARSPLAQEKWRLRWSVQADNANPLQKALANQVKNYQIIYTDESGGSRVENLVMLAPFLKVRANAACEPGSAERTLIDINSVIIEAGPFRKEFPVNREREVGERGFLDWLYLDQHIRITRGSKGSLFIHTREPEEQ